MSGDICLSHDLHTSAYLEVSGQWAVIKSLSYVSRYEQPKIQSFHQNASNRISKSTARLIIKTSKYDTSTTETAETEVDIRKVVENILIGKKPRLQVRKRHDVKIIFAS